MTSENEFPTTDSEQHPDGARTQTSASAAPAAMSLPPPSPRRRTLALLFSVALAALLVAAGTTLIRAGAAQAPRPAPVPLPVVETLVLQPSDGYETHRAYAARVEPAREASLSFESGGTLLAVSVEEGERVPRGHVLARLDTRLLVAKRARLAAARDALDSDAELARLALARQRELDTRGFAPGEALDAARLDVTRVAARIAEADAALALVDVELDKARLRAPFDALIGARRLDPGATVAAGMPVLALFEDSTPRLRVGLPPERARLLDTASTYTFVAGERTLAARLVARRGDVDARTRTVSVLFEPLPTAERDTASRADGGDTAGSAPALLFGELLELVLTEHVVDPVFEVPLTALAEDERGLWSVMTVNESAGTDGAHPRLARVVVDIAHLHDERAYVRAPLAAGTRIVADGRHRVVSGEQVRVAGADRHEQGA